MFGGVISVDSLFEQAMELGPTDRQDPTVRLVDALPVEKDPGYDEAWGEELDRRWAEHDADPGSAIPVEEFMAELHAAIRAE